MSKLTVVCAMLVAFECRSDSQVREKAYKFVEQNKAVIARLVNASNSGANVKVEYLGEEDQGLVFQLRNSQPKGGSGLIGNFRVNQSTLFIYLDVEPLVLLDSRKLRTARASAQKQK